MRAKTLKTDPHSREICEKGENDHIPWKMDPKSLDDEDPYPWTQKLQPTDNTLDKFFKLPSQMDSSICYRLFYDKLLLSRGCRTDGVEPIAAQYFWC